MGGARGGIGGDGQGRGGLQGGGNVRLERSGGTMSNEVVTSGTGLQPRWKSVLAVIAHPDHEPFGLGTVLDAFIFAGVRVRVLCLTHGQAWDVSAAPGDPAALRGAALASAAAVLAPDRPSLSVHRAGSRRDHLVPVPGVENGPPMIATDPVVMWYRLAQQA